MAYGQFTSNIMDVPLKVSSIFTPWVGDNGYKFLDAQTVRVLSIDNGSLADYNESSATTPFGSPTLVVPNEQVLTLAYNKSMLLRIQRTQMQDIPVSAFKKKTAMQNVDQVFIPAYDAYALGKVYAAIPSANKIAKSATRNDAGLRTAVNAVRTNGGSLGQMIAWVSFTLASEIQDAINYTGSDTGFQAGRNGYLGRLAGIPTVETPDDYFVAGVEAIVADKRAIINVKPKMDPKNSGMVFIDPVPGFSGAELQLRARGDVFVLNKKVGNIASIEVAASTTTTTTT